jgi:hypothetical protein
MNFYQNIIQSFAMYIKIPIQVTITIQVGVYKIN